MKIVIPVLFIAVLLFACDSPADIDVKPDEIISVIISEDGGIFSGWEKLHSEADDEFGRLDEIIAYRYLGNGSEFIDLSIIDSYSIISESPASAAEIGVIKVNDISDIGVVKDWVTAHFNYVSGIFSSYNEKEANSAKNGEVRTNGKYIYYAVFEDSVNILNKIDAILDK